MTPTDPALPSPASGVTNVRQAVTCFIDVGPVPAQALVQVPGLGARNSGCPRLVVWLSHGLRRPGTAGQERLKKGLLCSK
ncbi:hypothetical protein GCM10009721_39600 [Terrabacter tumescens]|uniref:Uncharacterized protein n=1 Tax=Terrabacter tumescens TaxID=60443 RepID=A0ABQ2IG54_9MICO|nr:hypothetical protein GCM10009721_39600 [Terrabacter tumescens]